jgi:hypothetical protein
MPLILESFNSSLAETIGILTSRPRFLRSSFSTVSKLLLKIKQKAEKAAEGNKKRLKNNQHLSAFKRLLYGVKYFSLDNLAYY